MDAMINEVVNELRSLNGFGLMSYQQCVRCERYVRRYPDTTLTGETAAEIAERLAKEV
jgi:hypothetical protein